MWEALRQEIVENHKARIDLIKWKLLVIAAIVGWSLDTGVKGSQQLSFWAISMAPVACLFVDSHCFHINLRTFVIGHFLRLCGANEWEYEKFVHSLRVKHGDASNVSKFRWLDVFCLEQGALTLPTLVICVGVTIWPIIADSFRATHPLPLYKLACRIITASHLIFRQLCGWSGILGLIGSTWLTGHYLVLKNKLMQDADRFSSFALLLRRNRRYF